VLILDEPTSVLTPGETEELFAIMRQLKAGGRAIVFISHKLKEVQEIADTITVLRRGRVVGQPPPAATDEELAALMVGRKVLLRVAKQPASPGQVVLDVRDLTVSAAGGGPGTSAYQAAATWAAEEAAGAKAGTGASEFAPHVPVNRVSFQVRAGEILGIAGVQGNGQSELCEALMGLRPAAAGSVTLGGRDITAAQPRQRIRDGIGYIPEDRQEDGLVAAFSVAENIVLDNFDRAPYANGVALRLDAIRESAARRVQEFDIRTTSIATPAGTLSGGNQQKVILAREIGRDLKVLLASQPTRGLDVGSIEFVHRRIVEQRDEGVAVIIVSSELDEIYALADRIAVMYEGRITGFRPPTVPEDELGLLMTGALDDAAGQPAPGPRDQGHDGPARIAAPAGGQEAAGGERTEAGEATEAGDPA
jgi:ABC-type uncharacterized transport system ATPase subunit